MWGQTPDKPDGQGRWGCAGGMESYILEIPEGSTNKNTILCTLSREEFAYHKSTSTLLYHHNENHIRGSMQVGNINIDV